MTTVKILQSMLTAALLSSAAAWAHDTIQVAAAEDGKNVHGEFKVGDARCVVFENQIRCSRSRK